MYPGGADQARSDAYLIAFWVVLFWFLREASMRWLWEPLARAAGIRDKRSVVRFAEQGWTLLYYVVFWTLGVVSRIRRVEEGEANVQRPSSTSCRARRTRIWTRRTSTLVTRTMLCQP